MVATDADVMALKNQVKKLEEQLASKEAQVTTPSAVAQVGVPTDSELIQAARKEILEKALAVENDRKALEGEKKQIAETKRQEELNKVVSQYGLTPEEVKDISDPKEIELVGLRKKVTQLTEAAKTPAVSKRDVDIGPGAAAPGSAKESDMDRAKRIIQEAEKKGFAGGSFKDTSKE